MPRPTPVKRRDGTVCWRVRFRLDGGGNPVSETFDDPAQASQFAALVEKVGGTAARRARDLTDTAAATTPTVAAAMDAHINACQASATPGTIARYRQINRDRITPQLGTIPVDMLTRTAVEKWVATMRVTPVTRGKGKGQPPSAKTMRNTQALLSAALQRQVDEGVLGRNVAKGVRMPRDTISREPVFLHADQVDAICEHAPTLYVPLIRTLYGLGLRFGEATALRPMDLDLDGRPPSARITRAWKEGDGHPYIGAPKTKRGIRSVSIPLPLVPVLRAQCEGRGSDELLFTTERGVPVRSGPFHTRVWQPAVAAAGLDPKPRVHDLRHSHASALIAAGIPLPVIQRRMGHSSVSVTADVYGHLAPDAAVEAAAAMAAAMAAPQLPSA